jgi:GNAT superfamily N-acetyltransferase
VTGTGTESAVALDAPFRSPRVDRFEEWLHAPAPLESTHPRFNVRRAVPPEFDAIYNLVNEAFGFKRPRSQYDWMYRRNPLGAARCWVVFDRASGRLVGNRSSWPWPMARGEHSVEGALRGDSVVAPGWQRQGIGALSIEVRSSHAWYAKTVALSWPNEKSRGSEIKRGDGAGIVGPVPEGVLILNAKAYLAEHNLPALVSAASGAVMDTALAGWRRLVLRTRSGLALEAVRRFDSSIDEVTRRCMTWPGFWSPHDAAFLNWRYLAHPTAQHLAFALVDGSKLAGCYVLKIDGRASWLMEFVAPVSPRRVASALLLHVIEAARAAGCIHLRFSAPPGWRHWKFFHAAGFLPVRSQIYLWAAGEEPERKQLTNWQWVPGDMDSV